MEIDKKWNAKSLIDNLNRTYSDVDIYFYDPIPYFAYAEDLYNRIIMGQIDIPITTKEMLEIK